MDRIPGAQNDNGVWNLQPQQYHGGLENEELIRHLLSSGTLERERARANEEMQKIRRENDELIRQLLLSETLAQERARAKAEMQKIQEAKAEMRKLQEAREERQKLQHRLQELSAVARREADEAREQRRLAEYSRLTNTLKHHVMSSDRISQWPDTMLANDRISEWPEPTELNPSATTATITAAAAQRLNSSELAGMGNNQFRRNSTAHDFDLADLGLRANVGLHQSPTSSSKDHCSTLSESQEQPFYQPKKQQLRKHTLEPSAGDHMTNRDPKRKRLDTSSSSIHRSTSAMPAGPYLPMPPEPILQLPERGKLVQAVLKAGPLLKTLRSFGSALPKWKNPPPAVDATEIPPIPFVPSNQIE